MAVLATLGGLLTPIILNTDTDVAAALFTYLAILDLGVLLLASRLGGAGLALLAFAGTQALYWGWLDRWYQAARLPVALGWATVFFLAFAAWAFRGSRSERFPGAVRLARALIILGAPALYFAVARHVLDDPSGRRLALVALALAGTYLVAARVAARSPRGGPRVALLHHAPALAFLALAPAVTLGRHDLVIAWSVEGLVLLLGGFTLSTPGLRAGGLAISALAWGRLARGARAERRPGGDVPHRAPGAAGHPRRRGDRGRRRARLPGSRARRGNARPVGALRTPAPPPGRGRERGAPPDVELGQFRTLAIPPPYVPVVKSVVWMLATMVLLALARGDGTRVLLGVATLLLVALVGEALGGTDRWARLQPSRPAMGTRASWPAVSSSCSPGSSVRWPRACRISASARARGSARWARSAPPSCCSGT